MRPRALGSIVVVVLALAACTAPSPVRSPVPPTAVPVTGRLVTHGAQGLTFQAPEEWTVVDQFDGISMSETTYYQFANFPLAPGVCSEPADLDCLLATPLPPGGLIVDVGEGGGGSDVIDRPWNDTIDGMPAMHHTVDLPPGFDVDRSVGWSVAVPGTIFTSVVVSGSLRGPGLAALEAQIEAIARSIRFSSRPAFLDPADAARILRDGVEYLDLRAHDPGTSGPTDYYDCFPRSEGSRTATLDHLWGMVLGTPIEATCSATIAATRFHLWRVQLLMAWPETPEHPAGVYREELYLTADGTWAGQRQLTPDSMQLLWPAVTPAAGGG